MVKYIIARQLVGKKVITVDGFDVGRLLNLEISDVTGKITNIIVEPNLDSNLISKLNVEGGQLKIPYTAVQAVNDFIMVDRKNW
ncbi:MAG: PRC-barrel domain-containing protein [Candidatus Micrarchaeia archaeon]